MRQPEGHVEDKEELWYGHIEKSYSEGRMLQDEDICILCGNLAAQHCENDPENPSATTDHALTDLHIKDKNLMGLERQ